MTTEEAKRVERRLLFGDLNETAADIGAVMMKVCGGVTFLLLPANSYVHNLVHNR